MLPKAAFSGPGVLPGGGGGRAPLLTAPPCPASCRAGFATGVRQSFCPPSSPGLTAFISEGLSQVSCLPTVFFKDTYVVEQAFKSPQKSCWNCDSSAFNL